MRVPGAATDLQTSPDGRRLGVAWEGGVTVFEANGAAGATIAADAVVRALAFSPDGSRMAVGCEDGSLRITDASTGEEVVRGESEHGGLVSVSWAAGGELVAAGHFEPWVGVFAAATGERLLLLDPDVFDDEGRTSVVFLPDGRLLSTALDTLVIWILPVDPRSGRRSRRKRVAAGEEAHLIDLDVRDGAAAGLAELEGRAGVRVWDLSEPVRPRTGELPGRCRRLRWLPDGVIAVARDDGIAVIDAGRVFQGDEPVACLALAGDVLYGATDDGAVLAWDATTGSRR